MSVVNRIVSVTSAVVACGLVMAQQGPCTQQAVRGVWCLTCNGFTDLSKYRPNVPQGTLVPVAMLGRMVIDASGNGAGDIMMSLAGNITSMRKEENFTVNSDCTAEKSYTLTNRETGQTMSGTAKSVVLATNNEIRSLILNPGDVVLCRHRKLLDATRQD